MYSRKRRKTQMLTEMDNEDAISTSTEESLHPLGCVDKEQEIWDAFREEYFEAIEQLPLSLHRHHTLIRELEEQSIVYMANLLLTFKRYIAKRRIHVRETHTTTTTVSVGGTSSVMRLNMPVSETRVREEIMTTALPLFVRQALSNPNISPELLSSGSIWKHSFNLSPERVETTQQMLSHVGYLIEELLRASDEKVNIAQAACETVNQHACLLEDAIKEQKASISSGSRPGHLETLNLPELVPPRWAQVAPATPTLNDEISLQDDKAECFNTDCWSEPPADSRGRRQKIRSKRGKATVSVGYSGVQGVPLTITLPGQTVSGDPEEKFCRCKRVSFGAMVGCDNDKCEGQWFHLGCVGLAELPTAGIWYCSSECRTIAEAKSTIFARKRKRK